ncbi:pentatricopeptide repeat-containing protein At5g13770, chloroplastic [Beta vulgaris subsp. vulgaris]|uniref:pentatricopeptide repeat-containing protein At5g13770, chloroplastic n=1 Tax=Beta vulgaris subsp. vulgaris TaxID=3555 RepID=UPI0020370D81|nr:pentatricopeptide repeat-containing protein At5g13770, chloroplastic [Beta vulgaris subsp. vulgaris]
MAIPTSSGISPANFLNPLHNSTKFTIFKAFHHFLSPPWTHPKFIIIHSSAYPPPVLQEESSPVSPLVDKINYETPISEFQPQNFDERNLNKLIRELLKDSRTEDLGFEYYEKAKSSSDFQPQKTTFKSLLRYLVKSKKWDLISLISRDMKMYQILPDKMFCARIVSTCIKARKSKVAYILLESFEFDKKVAVFAYNSALRNYNKLHMYSVTIQLYEKMISSGVVLDSGGYVLIMEAYKKVGNFMKVVEIFSELEGSEQLENVENYTQIYGILLHALGRLGQSSKALEQYKEMGGKGVPRNASIYATLIGSLAEAKEISMVEQLVEEAESKQMLKDPALFLKLVIMYVKEGLLERTLDVVNKMKSANLKISDCIFCAIVNGYAKKRGLKVAARVYQELVSQGCEPGQVTYSSIINVYFRLALFYKAKKVFDEMQERGFDKCVVAYSTMIVMYGKMGQLREAMTLLAKMKEKGCEPNVWVYNALIDSHGRVKNMRQVDKIWKEMKRRKVEPDRVSYTSIIGAYSRAREYETCTVFYDEYRKSGGVIDLALAGIMVGVFSKINRIDEIIKLLQDLKAEGTKMDTRLYRSALNALRDAGLQMQVRWLEENFERPSMERLNK